MLSSFFIFGRDALCVIHVRNEAECRAAAAIAVAEESPQVEGRGCRDACE
jgi:hypothetical protein